MHCTRPVIDKKGPSQLDGGFTAALPCTRVELRSRLDALREVRGAEVVAQWHSMARRQQWRDLVSELLVSHYDPIYQRSMTRNFSRLADARPLQVGNGSPPAIEQAARQLLESCPADRGLPLRGSVGSA